MDALDDAASYVEMYAPDLADGPLANILEAAERLHRLVLSNPLTAPVVREAELEYQQALIRMRDAIRHDLKTDSAA